MSFASVLVTSAAMLFRVIHTFIRLMDSKKQKDVIKHAICNAKRDHIPASNPIASYY